MVPQEKRFNPRNFTLLLVVAKPVIPGPILARAQKNNLVEKREFHISVAVSKNARKISECVMASLKPDQSTESIRTLFKRFSWEYSLTNEYVLQKKLYRQEFLDKTGETNMPEHSRRSIVQKVYLPDIIEFYRELNKLLQMSLTVPVPHITLFGWSDYKPIMDKGGGIGINSKEEFEANTIETWVV